MNLFRNRTEPPQPALDAPLQPTLVAEFIAAGEACEAAVELNEKLDAEQRSWPRRRDEAARAHQNACARYADAKEKLERANALGE